MSEALKARLKKCGRTYKSPVSQRSTESSTKQLFALPQSVVSPSASPQLQHSGTPSSHRPSTNLHKTAFKSPMQTTTNNIDSLQSKDQLSFNQESVSTRRTLIREFTGQNHVNIDNKETDLPKSDHYKKDESERKRRKVDLDMTVVQLDEDLQNMTVNELKNLNVSLMKILAEKQERLRRLESVKVQRLKNNVSELEGLTAKWRQVAQEAVLRLHDWTPEPKPTLTQLVDHLQLDYKQLRYISEEESFA